MAFFPTNEGGGFFNNLPNIFMTPDFSQTGILTDAQQKELRNQATKAGLLGTALTYLATPKTENYGSALPYLAKAGLGGMNAAQDVYGSGLTNLYRQRLSEQKSDPFGTVDITKFTPESIQAFQQSGNKDYSVLRPTKEAIKTETPFAKIDTKDYTPKSLAAFQKSGNFEDLIPKPDAIKATQDYTEPQLDQLSGKYVFLPKRPGLPIKDLQGNIVTDVKLPEKAEKAATESQAKAATFYSQMTSASDELKRLQQEGFDPSSTLAQTAINLAGTPLRVLAGPQAQRAKQIQEQWTESFLRIKTGAAATKDEIRKNTETFFPKLGETDPSIIAQKERARAQAEQDVLRMTKEGGGRAAAKPKELSAQDKQALDWANANATDPRAAQIKQRLGL
jgi:hypothetical protein